MVDLSKYEEIIIWGANVRSDISLGRAIERLQKMLVENGYWSKVTCIVDSNDSFHGKERLGIPIRSPLAILDHPKALVIINTISINAVQGAMKEMGVANECLIIPYYFYHGSMDIVYCNDDAKRDIEIHEDGIRDLYYLDDDRTKRYLNIIFELRRKAQDDLYTSDYYAGTGENLAYFCDVELAPKGNVTYVDAGAYIGDSIEPVRRMYGERLKKIIAFEPDEMSRERLNCYIRDKHMEDKAHVLPYALGDENKTIKFISSSGTSSAPSEQGNITVEQRTFDELSCADTEGTVMVKMDIEGAELGALKGMKKLIQEKHPYLAICLYHKVQDLYEVAHYIKSLYPQYRLYLRGGWHLECWAVPQEHFDRKERKD